MDKICADYFTLLAPGKYISKSYVELLEGREVVVVVEDEHGVDILRQVIRQVIEQLGACVLSVLGTHLLSGVVENLGKNRCW